MYNSSLRETKPVLSVIDPVSQGAGAVNGDIIDMQKVRRVLYILSVGALGTNATVDYKIQSSAASNMGSAADLSGKAITQLTKTGTDDNKQVMIEVTAEEVAAAGHRYIRDTLTVGVAACLVHAIALGDFARFSMASENDLASVKEQVG